MAKQKVGVYDRVLECAKEEFLSRGFLDASLRTIAQEAETSTGSIYTRFGDKEGLFRALAEPVVDEFKAMFRKVQEDFHQFPEEEQRAEMGQYTARHQEDLLDYIYDHFDVFRLLCLLVQLVEPLLYLPEHDPELVHNRLHDGPKQALFIPKAGVDGPGAGARLLGNGTQRGVQKTVG